MRLISTADRTPTVWYYLLRVFLFIMAVAGGAAVAIARR